MTTTLAHRPAIADEIAEPQMSSQERVAFVAYIAMSAMIVMFLALTAALWLT